jgi:predicted O-methyltransferase YrrM
MSGQRQKRPIIDVIAATGSLVIAPLAALVARLGPARIPITYRLWDALGVSPLRYHYYQPISKLSELPEILWENDDLKGIDFNIEGQLAILRSLNYQEELYAYPIDDPGVGKQFFYKNSNFGSGDAEIYYALLRYLKPKRVIEIGGGYSTLIGHHALEVNGNSAEHICIEPYEMPWLEKIGLTKIVRSKVEDVPVEFFTELEANDILFIDSSHILRPGGDVWFEYLHILPNLKPGVFVHIHDIFLPYPYPREWLTVRRLYWTEQYLLQSMLQHSRAFEVVLALHFLSKMYANELARACPIYAMQAGRNPGSFWMRKV